MRASPDSNCSSMRTTGERSAAWEQWNFGPLHSTMKDKQVDDTTMDEKKALPILQYSMEGTSVPERTFGPQRISVSQRTFVPGRISVPERTFVQPRTSHEQTETPRGNSLVYMERTPSQLRTSCEQQTNTSRNHDWEYFQHVGPLHSTARDSFNDMGKEDEASVLKNAMYVSNSGRDWNKDSPNNMALAERLKCVRKRKDISNDFAENTTFFDMPECKRPVPQPDSIRSLQTCKKREISKQFRRMRKQVKQGNALETLAVL